MALLQDFRYCEEVLLDIEATWVQEIQADPSMKHAAAALALAFFLDHMWQERPSKRVAASPWYETASSLACKMLAAHVSSAPQVSDSIHEHQLLHCMLHHSQRRTDSPKVTSGAGPVLVRLIEIRNLAVMFHVLQYLIAARNMPSESTAVLTKKMIMQDSLQIVASLLKGTLPKDHVILQCMERLAEKNMSANSKAKRKAAEEAIQVSHS